MKYMGGAIPLHMAMIASEFVYMSRKDPDLPFEKYKDMVFMIFAHIACICIRSVDCCLKRSRYMKETLSQIQVIIYMMAIMHV
jgi:hypothetical protein